MNAMDFSILNPLYTRLCGAILLSVLTTGAIAAPATPAKTTQRNELVLTLSDQWLATNSYQPAPADDMDAQPNRRNHKQRAVNVNCGMDANPLATYDNSLGNRLQGECNLGYQY